MMRRRVALAILGMAVAGFGTVTVSTAGPASAAGAHRALVVVETGATTYRKVVTFDGASITGIQALELAGADPKVYSYAGQGGAVCRLFGVGRDAGPNCLGGADGDNRYWGYFRAPSGTSSFTYSRAGAGSVQVRDGDVEGWKFATGQAPAWSPVPPEPTTTTTIGQVPPPPTPPPAGSGGAAPAAGPSSAPPPGATPEQIAAFWAALASTTTTLAVPSGTAEVQANRATRGSARPAGSGRVATSATGSGPPDSSGGDGGAGSLALFAIVAVALGGGGVLLRRSRRRIV